MQEHLAAAADSDLVVIVEVIVAEAAVVDVVAVAARARYTQAENKEIGAELTIGTGEGVAACHQARSSRKGRQDQEHGGDVRLCVIRKSRIAKTDSWQLPSLSARQGVPDRRLLPPQAQGRGHEDQARPEADPCRSAYPLQGHCRHR